MTAAMIVTTGLESEEIAESVLITLIMCFFSYFDINYFNKKNLNLLPDLVRIACIMLLVLIFGYWGMVYTVFFLVFLIIDAFSYSQRDFIIVIVMMAVAFLTIWLFQNDPIFQSEIIKNSFFLIISNAIFALAILLRMFASESLSMIKREKVLEGSQARLLKENDEISTIFDNMESAILSLNKENKIYFANKSSTDMFPVFKDKKFDKVPLDKLLLTDASGRQITLKEIVEKSEDNSYRNDLTITMGDKVSSINVSVTKMYDENKSYDGALVSLHSLNADEMLEKSRMEFSSLASHEIRTPLTVIEGYLSIMLMGGEFKYDAMTKEYLTTLHDTSVDLIKLSNDILSMSNIDEGSVRVDIERTDLGELVKGVVAGQAKAAKLKKLDIEHEISKVPVIDTDRTKVMEIMNNLIGNAIKFSTEGTISVSLDQVGEEIVISVEDNGIGIPDSSKDKIFSKFYQVENWDTRKNQGSGLGLFVSKSLAKRIGGDLELVTTSKKGTKFSLILPVAYPNAEDLKKHKDIKLKEFIEGF